uniref:Secreted protein n=1 Tax=Thraustotheca clavata TaxID=74557 RepID=A0A0A7CMF5_9STRA|nr:secreted protein [Thraustotheca clavata]
MVVNSIAILSILAVAVADDPFHWGPCKGQIDLRYECGALTVPLNHLNPNNSATIDIAVQRYRSSSPNPLGTILLNPGGPGGPGTVLAQPAFIALTGGEYHVLGFDPRGIGKSKAIRCSKDEFTAWKETQLLRHVDLPFERNLSTSEFEALASNYEPLVERCKHYEGDYLKYLSTAFVARDMDLIREALKQDLMHYMGFSYGTVLGATYANMFPHRVGRFIIDSVVDATKYTGSIPGFWSSCIDNMDDVFDGFAFECESAGPLLCPLAEGSTPRPYLAHKLKLFLDQVELKPLIVQGGNDLVRITSSAIRGQIFQALYSPTSWPVLAYSLSQMMNGTYEAPSTADVCPIDGAGRDMSLGGLPYMGNDGELESNTLENWVDGFHHAKNSSAYLGGVWIANLVFTKFWSTTPIERFTGPWNHTFSNKVLILSNVHDPVTPLHSAQHMHEIFGSNNSILVVREGYGHGASVSQPSTCMHKIVTDYFTNGVYPTTTYCKVDYKPFDPLPNTTKAMLKMAALVHHHPIKKHFL